ncbi:MAG: LytR/AlgR family response regulator transcription factor [Sphingomicrobium sp.]
MSAVRVILADDEALALDRLAELLGEIAGVEVVATVATGREAVEACMNLHPDLLLIDIEMPRLDGFDVVEALVREEGAGHSPPLVCFVTAYPQFAATAFDSGALDFLCKPVRLARLERTIERARTALDQRDAGARLRELLSQLGELREARAANEDATLWVSSRGEMVRVSIATIDWVQAEGEYVRLHCGEASYLLRKSIASVADRLSGFGFIRVHRSAVVNGERVEAIRRSRAGTSLLLHGGTQVPVGRKYRNAIDSLGSS